MSFYNCIARIGFINVIATMMLVSGCSGGGGSGDEVSTVPATPSVTSQSYSGSGLAILFKNEEGLAVGIMPGEIHAYEIEIFKAESGINTEVTLETDSPGFELVENNGLLVLSIDGSQVAIGNVIPVRVVVTNLDKNLAEKVDLSFSVLNPTLAASGTLTSAGGTISSPDGLVGVHIEQGQLSQDLSIEIYTAKSPSGKVNIRFKFSRDVSNEPALMSLITNLNALEATTAINTIQFLTAETEKLSSIEVDNSRSNTNFSVMDYQFTNIQNYSAYYIKPRILSLNNINSGFSESHRIPKVNYVPFRNIADWYVDFEPIAARLRKGAAPNENTASPNQMVPILFVHGYSPLGSLGGGIGTWGDFPRLMSEFGGGGKIYVPYEFQWRTNTSFKVAADDLASAIQRVYRQHGQPVRIVAHSYGGILVRTVIQGLAESHPDFEREYVRSVLTLGTPHSGIFETVGTTVGGIPFPKGRDFSLIGNCGQISCRQMGVQVDLSDFISEITHAGGTGSLLASLAGSVDSKLPADLPFVVGIGLKREKGNNKYDKGDGLITYEGQRFLPDINLNTNKRHCLDNHVGSVTELVLGAFSEFDRSQYDLTSQPGSPVYSNAKGYAHIGEFFSSFNLGNEVSDVLSFVPDPGVEYGEPYVQECNGEANCEEHAAYRLFKSILTNPNEFCDVIPSAPTPTTTGFKVTTTIDYLTVGNSVSEPYLTEINSGIEILSRSMRSKNDNPNKQLLPTEVDFDSNSIDIRYRDSAQIISASFHGYVFEFDQASPAITSVNLDGLSTLSAAEARVTLEGPHRVLVNVEGVTMISGDRILLNLGFGSSQPPPPPPVIPLGYQTFQEGNPGVENDNIFKEASTLSLTRYSLTLQPKPSIDGSADATTITVFTEKPSDQEFAQMFFEFGYSGTNCLVLVDDNNNVTGRTVFAEAASYSTDAMFFITESVNARISTPGAKITNPSGCGAADPSLMFLNRIEFQSFTLKPIRVDAVTVDRGIIRR